MRRLVFFVLLVGLAGCAATPPTAVHQPMTARPPAPRADPLASNGSIFQAGVARSLFEDPRARYVGDTLTISIVEKNSASTKSNTKNTRSTSTNASVDAMNHVPGKSFLGLGVDASSSNNLNGQGESVANNAFTGTIAVTVIETLPNGNLVVSGEKQVAINQGHEYIRFSGVVNPVTISGTNTVSSSMVADARIEYKASGALDEAQVMGWLARFFLTFLPF